MGDLLAAPALALLVVFAAGLLAWVVAAVLAAVGLVHCLVLVCRWLRQRWGINVDELPPNEELPDEEPQAVLWLACHSTACGHMQTRHDAGPDGAVICRACGSPSVRA
ncbi:hypothetical protein [Streptomyces sp. NPDC058595]|uniref:hypothetical protein n=1 Tax=Streptomyces sp. NPDC058595 TaxID=3346550 RepID=UPI0036595622